MQQTKDVEQDVELVAHPEESAREQEIRMKKENFSLQISETEIVQTCRPSSARPGGRT